MSTLLLSLLLLVLIAVGLLMGRRVAERFENHEPATTGSEMSPALVNLLGTPALAAAQKPVPQVDKLARDQDAVAAANAAHHEHAPCPKCEECKKCEKCEKCPDMSQYIRMDEVPCWNCTLP